MPSQSFLHEGAFSTVGEHLIMKTLLIFALLIGSYAMASVPAPYTPIKASATEFRCLGRVTKLGPMLLPAQITSAGKPMLSSPIKLSGLDGLTGAGNLLANNGDSASWEWHGESAAFKVDALMAADCDGFMWYDINVTSLQPTELKSLRLEIPRVEQTARYIHSANFQWGGQISRGLKEIGGKWSQRFMPYVWLGDEDRGLAWCCESDQGWMLSEPTRALLVETKGKTVLFSTTFLDHEETVSSPIHLRFGLQATPVKPVSFAWRAKARIYHGVNYQSDDLVDGKCFLDSLKDAGVKTVVFHDMWPEYYGQIVPKENQAFRDLIEACHKRGMKFLVYIGYGVARNAPEMQVQGRHDEWSIIPLIPWIPSYKPELRTFDATCARGGWQDWLVAGIDKLFTDYKLDGLYFDGTSEAFRCQNESHGCGYRNQAGSLHPTYPMLDVRRMMCRIADSVHSHRPDAILDVHMSASLTMPTLSFCDSYWDGEQYEGYVKADKVEIPLDSFRAEFMGYAHGLDAEFLCYINRPFTTEEAIAMAWLHGVEVRPGNPEQLALVKPLWKALDEFGYSSAKWQPYWKDSGVTAGDASVKASSWVRNGKALIFASHLKREPLVTVLRLDRKRLGLSGEVTATDALTGKPLTLAGDKLPIDFAGMSYRLIEIRTVG